MAWPGSNGYGRAVTDLDRGWRTARLLLEPLTPAHAAEMAPLLDDVTLHEFTGGTPASGPELAARYQRLAARRSADGTRLWGNWVVRAAATGTAAGTVQATLPAAGPVAGPAEIAWVIARAAQGNGYAKEAAASLADRLRADGWQVIAHIHPGHQASAAVAGAAGLSCTGEARDDGEIRWASLPGAGAPGGARAERPV
jgi:RimJ/RimL family protein N-acetyltransferase